MTLRHAATLALCAALLGGCPSGDGGSGAGKASPAGDAEASTLGSDASSASRGVQPRLPNVRVDAGAFVMGSEGEAKGGQECERPRQKRTIVDPYCIDLFEVTNRAYGMFLASPAATSHEFCHSSEPAGKDHTPAKATAEERTWGAVAEPFDPAGRADHPVVGVDWYDAYAFANWLGRRLPSEAEFERAARGTEARSFPWGEERPRAGGPALANGHWEDGFPMTAPVGSFPAGAGPCGAFDLAGNVWEWTADPFYAYEGAPEGTPEDGAQYAVRGGGWNSATAFLLRGAMRMGREPGYRSAALGFRTVSAEHVPQEAK